VFRRRFTSFTTSSLFRGIWIASYLSEDFYQRNLKHYTGSCKLRTADDRIRLGLSCKNGICQINNRKKNDWDVVVTVGDEDHFAEFILSQDPDILKEVIRDNISVCGNVNHLYKWGYLLQDLGSRVGVFR
jgi:hypothetical protein